MCKKIKKEIENFKQKSKSEKLSTIITFCFMFVGFIIGLIYPFWVADFTPASQKDFEPLYEQKQLLESDFSSIWNIKNAELAISDDSKVVTLNSEECKLILKFDEQFKLISSEEIDNYTPTYILLIASVFLGVVFTGGAGVILTILIFLFLVMQNLFEKMAKEISKKRNK